MNKKLSITISICIMLILGAFLSVLFTIYPKTDFSSDISDFNNFEQMLINELQNDDYSYIEVDKNVTLNNLKQKIDICEHDNVVAFSNNILTKNEFVEFCNSNNYIVQEEDDCYKIRNKFSLKRLIVFGDISSDYGANKVISYNDFKLLCFDNEQVTQKAYQSLLNSNISVSIDSVVTTESEEYIQANASVNSWARTLIDVDSYTDYSTSKTIAVAVLDTGINTSHELFTNRFLYKNSKIVGFSYYDSVYSYSKSNMYFDSSDSNQCSFEDDGGHGSHVSGIICSLTPENVKIIPLKVLNYEGSGSWSAIWTALEKVYSEYSNSYTVACTNLSLGADTQSSNLSTDTKYWNERFEKLYNKNILNIVAAGNCASNAALYVPSACDEYAIVVSALTKTSTGYSFDNSYSNYGSSVDICAPGSYIYSAIKCSSNTDTTSLYGTMSGTSMATPQVAGCVALLCLDENYYSTSESSPTYTASIIQDRLLNNVKDYGDTGRDDYYGYGVLCMTGIGVTKTIDYTASDTVCTYDGNYHNISVIVNSPSNYSISYLIVDSSGNTITSSLTDSRFKDAGDSVIVYYLITASGYKSATGTKNLTINKRNLTYAVDNQTATYGDSNYFDSSKYRKSAGTIVSGDNLNLRLTTTAQYRSSVGEYGITLEYSNTNYNIIQNTAKLTINPRNVGIQILNSSNVYGDSYSEDHSNYSVISGSVLQYDDLGVKLDYSGVNYRAVATYVITLGSYTNSNYNVTATSGYHSVLARNLTVYLNDQSSVYGDSILIDQTAYRITSGNIVYEDTVQILIESTAQANVAGDYQITATCSNPNYSISTTTATYSVQKRNIELKTLDQESDYGCDVNLDNSKFVIVSGSFAYSDKNNVVLSTLANNLSNVGKYEIALTINNNYNITLEKGYLTIKPRQLTIRINVENVYYGDRLNLDDSQFVLISGEIVNGDDVDIILSATANSGELNNYIVSANSSNANYVINVLNCEVEILRRPITIKTYQYSTYGSNINLNSKNYTVTNGNVVNNDDLELEFSTTANNLSNVGVYQVTLLSFNDNYNVTIQNSYLEITPKTININLENQSSVYGEIINLNNTKYSLHRAQLVNSIEPEITLSTNATSSSPVGEYEIYATTSNANYKLNKINGIYSITKRKITIRLYDQTVQNSFKIDFNKEDYDILSGTVVNDDDLNIELYSNVSALSLAGNYDLMATYSNDNYEITFTDADLTVEFSYVDVIIILTPILVLIIVGTIVVLIILKRKKRASKFYNKWI